MAEPIEHEGPIQDLMANLMQAVETSLAGSTAVREALAELVRNGYEARLYFVANVESAGHPENGRPGTELSIEAEDLVFREIGGEPDEDDLAFELTSLDRDFLRSLKIRAEVE